MLKRGLFFITVVMFIFQQTANAVILDWSGNYRIEYVDIDKTTMAGGSRKSYLLNNLVLSPRIIPSDGIEVISRIHLTENSDPRYRNSQLGWNWGGSVRNPSNSSSYMDDSNSLAQFRPKTDLSVSQLYLKLNQEWGALVVGRAPVHFGLGITHNAGNDPFAHWYDTRDVVAYKMHIGNLFLMPSVSTQFANDFQAGNEIVNQTLHLEYKNPDTGDWLGVFYETSRGNSSVNDVPVDAANDNALRAKSVTSPLNLSSYNVILGKDFSAFNFRVEGGFQSGSSGAVNRDGKEIRMSGFAVVAEVNLHPGDSKNQWNLKTGTVSGDNPDTEDFEGYLLDRNYDLTFLLFNHALGQSSEIFKTKLGHPPSSPNYSVRDSADDEFASNVLFVAPQWTRQLADRWIMRNTLAFARLNNTRLKVGTTVEDISADVDFEWDLGFSYKANDNVEWRLTSGLLIPGKAFKMGTADLKTSSVFGLTTAAAITF